MERWCRETHVFLKNGLLRASRLPISHRKKLVWAMVRNRMSGVPKEEYAERLQILALHIEGKPITIVPQSRRESAKKESNGKIESSLEKAAIPPHILRTLLGEFHYQDERQLLETLEASVAGWIKLLSRHAPTASNLQEAIFEVDQKIQESETAMKAAAQESFGRLLQALGPDQLKKNIERGPTKIGPFLKAAIYEEYEEKHANLLSYHNKGYLARDFKEMYRKQLRVHKKGEK